jgi:hypothetical protein
LPKELTTPPVTKMNLVICKPSWLSIAGKSRFYRDFHLSTNAR